MAQIILNDGELGSVWRDAVNDNFTELYGYSLKIAQKDINSNVSSPAAGQDGFAITWDNAGGEYVLAAAGGSSTKIEDGDGDTYVDVEASADVDTVNFGSPATTTTIGFKFISDTGGTPTEVLQIDGDGNLLRNNLYQYLYTTGNSVFIGTNNAHSGVTSGALNSVFIGNGSGEDITDGDYNTLIGALSGKNVRTGESNACLGYSSGLSMGTGSSYCTYIGSRAGRNNASSYTTALGYEAGYTGDGNYSLYLGHCSGYYNTVSNQIIIDTIQRADAATELTDSPIVGTTNATKSSQTLQFNAVTTVSNDITGNIFIVDDGSTDILTVDDDGNIDNTGYIISDSYHKHTGHIRALNTYTTGTTALSIDNYYCLLDGTSNTVTLTLPAISATNNGTEYVFLCTNSANTCTVQTLTSGDYIGLIGTTTSFTITAGETSTYVADNNLKRWLKLN